MHIAFAFAIALTPFRLRHSLKVMYATTESLLFKHHTVVVQEAGVRLDMLRGRANRLTEASATLLLPRYTPMTLR